MTEETFFIYDPLEGKRKKLTKELEFIFDVDKLSKAKVLRKFIRDVIIGTSLRGAR
ncbi:hypothetical protein K8R33_04895 [archaeon]|nr:hypothetical protein [archaeon]